MSIRTSCDNSSNSSSSPLASLVDSCAKCILQRNPPNDCRYCKSLSNGILNDECDLLAPHLHESDTALKYELKSFIIRTDRISNVSTNGSSRNKKPTKPARKSTGSPSLLHQLLLSPSNPTNICSLLDAQASEQDTSKSQIAPVNENPPDRSPKYRPRHSSSYSSDVPSVPPENNPERTPTPPRQLCRSPVYTRRPTQPRLKMLITKRGSELLPLQTATLAALDSNENILSTSREMRNALPDEHQISSVATAPASSNKRALESPSSEQILIKRRYQKPLAMIIVQQHYCVSYPVNIPRCVDCQTLSVSDVTTHLTGCRFQYCRTLQYHGEQRYELEGFTTVDDARAQGDESLLVANSGGQPALDLFDANYIVMQISKLFCLMLSFEETQRTIQNEKQVISKRCIPGWREVCDDCLTTVFNYHYMCRQCGYMSCVECAKEFSQMNVDKRKRLNRTCTHPESFCLSEFIPWDVLAKLRSNCTDYLSKLRMDCSPRLYHSSKSENLSAFIKSLKMKRFHDVRDTQQTWSAIDCDYDSNIEFFCRGRLPVFNEWYSENAKSFFQRVWAASCPVLVKRVHQNLSKTLWQPSAFKVHMIDHRDTPALWDCQTLTPVPTDETILTRFWDGFERLHVRLRDEEHGGRPRILKLKDWPTKKDFASVFPTLLHDLMTNIPFGDYTRRSYTHGGVSYRGGALNIVERLPACLVKPDLGPKLYVAYSQLTNASSRKAGTTNLHIDVSDAVNVLVYVGIGGYDDSEAEKEQERRQVEEEIRQSNIDEVQLQRLRNGERPGALWHLFRSDDAKKIREYINRAHRKTPGSDSIHDQTAYLEREDLEILKAGSQVEAYPIVQFLGDAIFIPSGAPHQVKNLHSCIKIAEDFVSPENLDRCLITTNEFRSLSKTHTNHADILQAKNILYYTTRDAFHSLSECNESLSASSIRR